MTILISTWTDGHLQGDGRTRYVTEVHVDSVVGEIRREYGPVGPEVDRDAVAAAYAAMLTQHFADEEARALMELD